jgi:hypothetical protein
MTATGIDDARAAAKVTASSGGPGGTGQTMAGAGDDLAQAAAPRRGQQGANGDGPAKLNLASEHP